MPPARPAWMAPADTDLLAVYDDHPIRLTPMVLAANTDLSRQYVSQRVRALKRAGLLFKDEDGLYVLTPYGRDYLDGTVDPDSIDEGPPTQYEGRARATDTNIVTADGVPLADRVNFHGYDIRDMAWGYAGHGPKLLALALVGDVHNGETADAMRETDMHELVEPLEETWTLPADAIHDAVLEAGGS